MEAEKLRAILATPPSSLEKTAQRVEVPLPIAKQVRIQALNLMMGRCVLCAEIAPMGVCNACKKGDPNNYHLNFKKDDVLGFTKDGKPVLRVTRERFLRQLDPRGVLVRRECESCGNIFSQSVDSVVKNLLNYGRPYLAKLCKKCSLKKRKLKPLPLEDKSTGSEECNPDVYEFKPFADSEVMKKMRQKLRGSGKGPKRGKKVKKQGPVCG